MYGIKPERDVPKDFIKTIQNHLGVAYIAPFGNRFLVRAYGGKRNTPDINETWREQASAEQRAHAWLDGLAQHEARKAQRRAERNQAHDVPVGAIFVNSWGYEQTNVDFYQVVSTTEHTVTLRQIRGDYKATGIDRGYSTPVKDAFLKDSLPFKKRVTVYNGQPYVSFDFGSGGLWDGKPEYVSSYA